MSQLAEMDQFFAPASTDMIDGLIGEYKSMRGRIEALTAAVNDEAYAGALFHCIEGNCRDGRHGVPTGLQRIFESSGAIAHLDAYYWDRTLKLTDVLDIMPQARRSDWHEQIRECKTPPYEEDSVRATLIDLLGMRSTFFAERVDGIFKALSRTHVTNQPEGFSKRMIINNVIDAYGHVSWDKAGVINDLRCVIAKFMGRDEPPHETSRITIDFVRSRNGSWAKVDGGIMRMRVYNGVGTAHLEIHPDMAWRLNAVLASLYPMAIPESFRTRPKRQQKKVKEFDLFDRPLPFYVLKAIASMKPGYVRNEHYNGRQGRPYNDMPNTRIHCADLEKAIRGEVSKVMTAIGGVREKLGNLDVWKFDYNPGEVIGEILCTGCIPDQKSHQFYPTPERLAKIAVELAGIAPHHKCLEPSAGIGGIAKHMPFERTTCIEISSIHVKALESQAFNVVQADFIEWDNAGAQFDRIVMNPPYSEGRWLMHIERAAKLLAPSGRLVAIIPASAKNKDLLQGLKVQWHGPYENEFSGTSTAVVILVAEAQA